MKTSLMELAKYVTELGAIRGLTTFQQTVAAIISKLLEIELLQDERIAALEKKVDGL